MAAHEALQRFLVEEGVGQDIRLRWLAQAVAALYPGGTEGQRWVDNVLARKKGLGSEMLRLQSLQMGFFRGVREGHIEGLTDVNLLIGRNNSGKTTVLEAITRLARSAGFQNDLLGRDENSIWQRHVESPSLWYRQDKTRDVVLKGTVCQSESPTKSVEVVQRFRGESHGHPLPTGMPQQSPSAIDATLGRSFFAGVTVFLPADAFNSTVEQRFWHQLLSNRRDKALTNTLNEVFGLKAESFQLLPNNQLMVLFEDYSLPLDVQGDGTRAAMRTLMVLTMLQGTMMLLEEPECHQHPGSLERFAKALCTLARDRQVQLFVSTHSAECVRVFLESARAAKSEVAVYHLTLENGRQEARRLTPDDVELLRSTGVDVRFLDLYA